MRIADVALLPDGLEMPAQPEPAGLMTEVVPMMVGGWSMGWMWIWPVLLVSGVVVLGYVAARLVRGRTGSPKAVEPVRSQASRILDERYARGEIDDEEYRRRRGELL